MLMSSAESNPISSDYLCKHRLSADTSITRTILTEVCRQWGKPATKQLLQNLQNSFQSNPILAGRYGLRNVQILLQELESMCTT